MLLLDAWNNGYVRNDPNPLMWQPHALDFNRWFFAYLVLSTLYVRRHTSSGNQNAANLKKKPHVPTHYGSNTSQASSYKTDAVKNHRVRLLKLRVRPKLNLPSHFWSKIQTQTTKNKCTRHKKNRNRQKHYLPSHFCIAKTTHTAKTKRTNHNRDRICQKKNAIRHGVCAKKNEPAMK